MASYREYIMARSLEEAYALNQKKSSVIVAGNMWLRMCGLKKQTAVDLSALGLDQIEETPDAFDVGAMATLRRLETDEGLNRAFGGAFAQALAPIVGTQFRNGATLGGSVYSRFGFSDVSTLLLTLNADVLLYRRGAVPLSQYQTEPWDRDIVTGVRIPKGRRAAVRSVRFEGTDFPVLVCAASVGEDGLCVALGARPSRAMVVARGVSPDARLEEIEETFEQIARETPFGSNRRASEAYRRKIAPVLMARAARAAMQEEGRA